MKLWLSIMAASLLTAFALAYALSATDCRRDEVWIGGFRVGERCP